MNDPEDKFERFYWYICKNYVDGEIAEITWMKLKKLIHSFETRPYDAPKRTTPAGYDGWERSMQKVWNMIPTLNSDGFTAVDFIGVGVKKRKVSYLLKRLYDIGCLVREERKEYKAYVYRVSPKHQGEL